MRVGRLLGAEVRLDPLLLALLGLAVAAGYAWDVAVFAAALVLHELGHLLAAHGQELPVTRLVLHPLGAVAHIPALGLVERRVALVVTLAGPATSLALAGLGVLVLRHGPAGAVASARLGLWLDLNLALGLVNLLPVLPLDGGQALRAHFAARGASATAGRRLVRAGQLLGLVLMAGAAVAQSLGRPLLDVGVFGLWLTLASSREGAQMPYARTAALVARRAALRRGAVLAGRTLVALPSVPLSQVFRATAPRAHHEVRVVTAEGAILGTLDEETLYAALIRLGPQATLAEVLAAQPPPA